MEKTSSYIKIASHEAKKGEFQKCLLLYSGGLDTSVMLKWIQDQYECEIITLTLDLGQTADNLEEIKAKALKLGAKEAIVYDAKDEFADLVLSQAIQANADYQ
jgi:argininosuccinate synthase